MPKATHHQAIARLLEILKCIPGRGAGITYRELTDRLCQQGYEASKRTIERDLTILAAHFPLIHNDKSIPHGWRWMEGAVVDYPGLGLAEAMSLHLIEQLLQPLLPAAMLEALRPRFVLAHKKLESLAEDNPNSRWLEKVRQVQPSQPLLPPQLADGVLETVQEALLLDRQLDVHYRRPPSEEAMELRLHPLGLIQRGTVLYLAATAFDYEDVRLYALHRIPEAHLLDDPARRPDDFSLDGYIEQGSLHFGDGEIMDLQARLDPWLADILRETPLSKDQMIEENGPEILLRATVHDTWQLRWWILSQGQYMTVLAPESLRREIGGELRRAAAKYKTPRKS